MKVKVDKEEYERLLKCVKELEEYRDRELQRIAELAHSVDSYMEDFFENKCKTVMIKRDKDMIMAELRKQVMDNLFKEEE